MSNEKPAKRWNAKGKFCLYLLFIICTYILFTPDPTYDKLIFTNPGFWICVGILIFVGCTFFYNVIYTNLMNFDKRKALGLFGLINMPLNIVLYTFIITGILCTVARKKRSQ